MDNSSAEQIVYGIHPVLEALEDSKTARRAIELTIQAGLQARVIRKAIEYARRAGVKVKEVPLSRLSQLCEGGKHQGLMLRMGPFPYAELEEVLERTQGNPEARILILDQLQDPRNIGALLRSAVAFGFSGVVLPKDHSAPINAAAIKTSVGATFKIPIARVTNLARAIKDLKEKEFWIYGADSNDNSQPFDRVDWRRRVALVLGSEGAGLRRLTRDRCDGLIHIPHTDDIDSLNVSVAGGILMYALHNAWTK